MSLLRIEDLSFSIAGRALLEGAGLVVDPGRKIGLIGRNPGRYNLHVGGAADGSRLNRLLRENADGSEILSILDRLFARYAAERSENEGFGDFVQRVNVWA